MSDSNGKRKKGGAEKLREKKRTLLMNNAKICGDIRVMFSKLKNEVLDNSEEIPENSSQISTNTDVAIDNLCENEVLDNSEEIPEKLSQISTNTDIAIDDLCKVKVMNLNVSESMFKKPLPLMLDNYFEYHPLQPVSHTFFNCKKVFYKADGTNRFWLTFDGKSLFY